MNTRKTTRLEKNTSYSGDEAESPHAGATKLMLTAEAKSTEKDPQTDMSELDMVLREIRDFRRENGASLKEIREEILKTNTRVEEAERRIMEAEERIQNVEDATLELLGLQRRVAERLTDQESRSRRDNIRIHGVKEETEKQALSMVTFVESLLKDKLELPGELELNIERAHRASAEKPPASAPPRSIVVKFQSYRTKEMVVKAAWQKKGFTFEGRRVIIDHDYAPEILKQRKEYTEAKRVLKEKKIRFQTPFPARLRVFYEGSTVVYNTAAEATKDMKERGLSVTVVEPVEDMAVRIQRLTWRGDRGASGASGKRKEDASRGYKKKLETFRRGSD